MDMGRGYLNYSTVDVHKLYHSFVTDMGQSRNMNLVLHSNFDIYMFYLPIYF